MLDSKLIAEHYNLPNYKVVSFQGLIKNNNGKFFSEIFRDFLLLDNNHRNLSGSAITCYERAFDGAAEWVIPYTYDVFIPKLGKALTVKYMLVGNQHGVLARLKKANQSEKINDIGNGYVVVWEPEAIPVSERMEGLIVEAKGLIKSCIKALAKTPTDKTCKRLLQSVHLLQRKAEFIDNPKEVERFNTTVWAQLQVHREHLWEKLREGYEESGQGTLFGGGDKMLDLQQLMAACVDLCPICVAELRNE